MFLSDTEIKLLCADDLPTKMIAPFYEQPISTANDKPIISYGLSSYGYDVRLSDKFKALTCMSKHGRSLLATPLDPLHPTEDDYEERLVNDDGYVIIPAGGSLLGVTEEYFVIPPDVLAICVGRSTYTRLGLNISVTPLEPGWEGQAVIEMYNLSHRPIAVYANQGIAQLLFSKNQPCETTYRDRKGKYQGQRGVTTSRI